MPVQYHTIHTIHFYQEDKHHTAYQGLPEVPSFCRERNDALLFGLKRHAQPDVTLQHEPRVANEPWSFSYHVSSLPFLRIYYNCVMMIPTLRGL